MVVVLTLDFFAVYESLVLATSSLASQTLPANIIAGSWEGLASETKLQAHT